MPKSSNNSPVEDEIEVLEEVTLVASDVVDNVLEQGKLVQRQRVEDEEETHNEAFYEEDDKGTLTKMFKLRTGMIWFPQSDANPWSLSGSVQEQEKRMDLCGKLSPRKTCLISAHHNNKNFKTVT